MRLVRPPGGAHVVGIGLTVIAGWPRLLREIKSNGTKSVSKTDVHCIANSSPMTAPFLHNGDY